MSSADGIGTTNAPAMGAATTGSDGDSSPPVLGFLGLGAMGAPMVRSLLRTGCPVLAFDLAPERLATVGADGATAAASGDGKGTWR